MSASVKTKKVFYVVIVIVLIAVIASAAVLFATGRLYGGLKDPDTKVVYYQSVCNGDLIERYMKTAQDVEGNFSQRGLKPHYDEVVALEKWEQDPTCVYVALQYHVVSGDDSQADQAKKRLDELGDQGLYASYKMQASGFPVESYEEGVESYREAPRGDEQEVQGGGV